MNAVAAKRCAKCEQTRPIESFRPNARYAGGRVTWCDPCAKAYRAEHYKRNAARVKAQNADWHATHRETRNEAMLRAYKADPEAHIARAEAAKKRRPEHYRALAREYGRKQRAARVDVRLRSRISAQIRYCLSTGKGGRTTAALLGYSIEDLRVHLERQFLKGMTWDNMGDWHIDHIVPLASFTITGPDDPELRRAWSLANLRPLWAADNIRKNAKRELLL